MMMIVCGRYIADIWAPGVWPFMILYNWINLFFCIAVRELPNPIHLHCCYATLKSAV